MEHSVSSFVGLSDICRKRIGGGCALWAGLWLVAVGVGCAASQPHPASFDEPTSQGRIKAIAAASQREDPEDIPQLVRQLTFDDIVVRSIAIETLRAMTGEDFGYRSDDPHSQRVKSIERWVRAVRSGRFVEPAQQNTHSGAISADSPNGPTSEQSPMDDSSSHTHGQH